jgi:hypothetical protein
MKYVSFKPLFVIGFVLLLAACTKETSYETGANLFGMAAGTLKDSIGDCKGIVVKGKYSADTVLTDSSYILVQVSITASGNYSIYSDTVNGFWFRDSGYSVAGNRTLKIRGYGKPILPLNTDFDIFFNNSACTFTVFLITPPSTTVFSDYFPTTVGSNWGYDIAGSPDTLHVFASNDNTTFAGNSYRVFYSHFDPTVKDTTYFRKSGNNYSRYEALDDFSNPVDLLFLKDDQPILHNWLSPIVNTTLVGVPTEVRMSNTLLSVHQPRTVNGFVFDSVIQVKSDLQYKVVGVFQNQVTYNIYYAKNVGLIEVDIPGSFSQKIRRWRVY